MSVDVHIPHYGWDPPMSDFDKGEDPMMLSLIGGLYPIPVWCCDMAARARMERPDDPCIRVTPIDYTQMCHAQWYTSRSAPLGNPPQRILGMRIIVDPDIPEGIIRIMSTPRGIAPTPGGTTRPIS